MAEPLTPEERADLRKVDDAIHDRLGEPRYAAASQGDERLRSLVLRAHELLIAHRAGPEKPDEEEARLAWLDDALPVVAAFAAEEERG